MVVSQSASTGEIEEVKIAHLLRDVIVHLEILERNRKLVLTHNFDFSAFRVFKC